MTDQSVVSQAEAEPPVDGRVARRERNINAALDVVTAMFSEGDLLPTIEQVSKRSGISVRSLYRYFEDPARLYDAAVRRHRQQSTPLARLPSIGTGPLDKRITDFVAMRLRLHQGVGAAYRATVHGAGRHPRLRDELARTRNDFRLQFERQFAPELARRRGGDREALLAAGDVLTQLDSIDLLRRHRQLTVAETERTLCAGLAALLRA